MSKNTGLDNVVDSAVIGYADGIKLPAWIYNLSSKEILYWNRTYVHLFQNKSGRNDGVNTLFESRVKDKIDKSFGDKLFFVSDFHVENSITNQKFQIVINRLSTSLAIVTFLEYEPIIKDDVFCTTVLFCQLNGDIIRKSNKASDTCLEGVNNIGEILNDKDRNLLISTIRKSSLTGKSEFLSNIPVTNNEKLGVINIECIGSSKNAPIVAVVISAGEIGNEKLFKKSRAELADEINEILKLEISEHKKTQHKLDKTEVLATSIINSSLNIVITFNNKQVITEFNKKGQEITGYSREEIIGKNINLVLQNNGTIESIVKIVNNSGNYEGELWCIKKDGTKFGVFAGVSILKNIKNETEGFICSLRDISELNSWRERVEITEERFKDLFENATDLIQGISKDGSFLYTNMSWYKLLGYSVLERDKLTIFDIVDKSDLKAFKKNFEQILKGKETKKQIWTLKKKNGDSIIVESIDNLKIEKGKAYAVRSIMRDITAAKEAENLAREQNAKMEAIIESGNIMFWTVNRDIKLTSFNNEYAKTIFKLYGKKPVLDKGDGSPKDKFAPKDYHGFWNKKYREVFETGNSLFFQTKTQDSIGKIYYREIYLRPIRSKGEKGGVTEIAGAGIDITEKKLTERKINEQSSKIQTIFDSTNHMIWSLDTEGKITSFNQVFKEKLKERYNIKVELGYSGLDIGRDIQIKLNWGWPEILERLQKGEKLQFEIETKDKNKKEHIDDISISPIYNDDGEMVELAGIAQTVTFKKTAEKKLKDQASKINAIFNSTAMLIWTLDKNMRLVAYNKVFADKHFSLLGIEVSIGSNFLKSLKPNVSKEAYNELERYYKSAFNGENQQFEGVLHSADGEKRWMETFLNPIYTEHNEIKEISCLSHEITDKKIIEARMRESIHEKEVLLQEVHHRVKNNLQVISSILNLQSSYVKDENSLNILRESQNRIKSMSFIHESLYQTKDFAHIEFTDYILSLSKNLIHSYSITTGSIILNTDLEPVFLSLDQAIPCGLIANELISNALKYAFPDRSKGMISVRIREENEKIRIEIGDNGIGLPKDMDYKNSDSLGLQLVHSLIDQLDATIKVNTDKGTNYLITFDKQS